DPWAPTNAQGRPRVQIHHRAQNAAGRRRPVRHRLPSAAISRRRAFNCRPRHYNEMRNARSCNRAPGRAYMDGKLTRSATGSAAMRRIVPFVVALLAGTVPAAANVVVKIDKSTQHMTVSVDGTPRYSFVVSTGRAGYGTPNGTYHPERLARTWFSKKYYN